ncbi:hypothetical protein DSAG12_02567 [Promethearchaeum syntrophicum]|uniref:Uncharacterized protein n=1 Tax=Promethearchaeum syntrophicum TaxID=2594042 RepID=A0A5B9DCY4_9ARCH|nr:hypothetical protein [Candidatus Prometheoarchaeum syntrophicum]QEE16737.1 hypothetical protein DSAG12_02567 [Candidatus Prometheoarchaeum syntrophicum]
MFNCVCEINIIISDYHTDDLKMDKEELTEQVILIEDDSYSDKDLLTNRKI